MWRRFSALALTEPVGSRRPVRMTRRCGVWSLPDGRLLRTLRVPIDLDKGGKIYATAVSPDGRWIAAAGWDAQSGHKHFVYIFDASTGALVARVGPFNGIIHYLTFSPDGRWLAATSQVGVGLKVIDTQTWQIVATDKTYTGRKLRRRIRAGRAPLYGRV